MEKGSLRVDANLSVHQPGTPFGTKTEVKNMNSFANVERALEAERERQVAVLESAGRVEQVTLLFNAATGAVRPMRSKEESHDYRYFPDPDLPPLVLETGLDRTSNAPNCRNSPRPAATGWPQQYGLSAYHAQELTLEKAVAEYFEEVVAAGAEARHAVGWVLGEVTGGVQRGRAFPVGPAPAGGAGCPGADGTVSQQAAKRVYLEMAGAPRSSEGTGGTARAGPGRATADALGGWVERYWPPTPRRWPGFRAGEAQTDGVLRRAGHEEEPGQGGSQGGAAGAGQRLATESVALGLMPLLPTPPTPPTLPTLPTLAYPAFRSASSRSATAGQCTGGTSGRPKCVSAASARWRTSFQPSVHQGRPPHRLGFAQGAGAVRVQGPHPALAGRQHFHDVLVGQPEVALDDFVGEVPAADAPQGPHAALVRARSG